MVDSIKSNYGIDFRNVIRTVHQLDNDRAVSLA